MNTRDMELKVMAYLDNELSPAEAHKVGAWISSDAAARELYNELKETRELLMQNEPVLALPESRDFFWSKIQRGIASAEREPARAELRPWWMRFLAPVAGSVALFALLLSLVDRGNPTGLQFSSAPAESTPLHQFEEAPNVSTITFRSEAEGVTVVWLSTQ